MIEFTPPIPTSGTCPTDKVGTGAAGEDGALRPPPSPANGPSMRDRVLFVMPESHAFPREDEARELARTFKGENAESTVALFLESRRHESGPETSEAEVPSPFSVHGVGSAVINDIYFPLTFLQLASEFCRFAAVNRNPAHPRVLEITTETLEKARHFYEIHRHLHLPDPILAVQEMLLSEIDHAARYLLGRVEFTMPELAQALTDRPETGSGQIPRSLSSIMMRVLHKVTPKDVEGYNRFRGELERGLKVQTPKLEQKLLDQLRSCIYREDAFGAFKNADALMTSVRQVREHTFPYFILRQAFDIGILSCGLNHGLSKTLDQALQKAGIKVFVDFEGMNRSIHARDS